MADRRWVTGSRLPIGLNDGPQVILDISTSTAASGEQGLLGAAFSPAAPLLYVHYTDLAGDSVVEDFAIDDQTGIADPLSARIVLTVDQPYENHNGGKLAFGPDGYLYIGLGDGGLANDPNRTALDLSSPLGKILRLDPTPTGSAAFTVPDDNPYVLTPGADPLVWSLGLRNPWKFSFDSLTGDLWIADVGQNQYEEINFAAATVQPAGSAMSFGWSAYEGVTRFNADQDAQGQVDPLVTYARDNGRCSITSGEVYRGEFTLNSRAGPCSVATAPARCLRSTRR